VSHGAPGCLYLGNCQLNLTNIYDYRQQLQNWAKINRILLYGCQVAAGDAGTEFINKLSQITGAKIAASSGRVGNAALGGSWELEVSFQAIKGENQTFIETLDLSDLQTSGVFQPDILNTYPGVFAPTLVGVWDRLSYAIGVTVVGNYAYAVGDTLEIIDISNPSNPTFKGNYNTSGYTQDVQIVGNYAYVADSGSGLQIIDISNPTNPTLKGNYYTPGLAYDVQIVGNYAYVADYDSGLQIIDISNPTNPTLKGNYNTSGLAFGVQIVGNYAYVADYNSGLQIIDISNPTNPTLKGNYDTSGYAYGVQIVGNYAYVADYGSGLQIIDIGNPTNPTLKGNYDTSGYAEGVQVVGNYAYVADSGSGLQIIDISNPTNPTLKGNYDTSGWAYDVQVMGKYAYVADGEGGLKIIDVSDPTSQTVTLSISPSSVSEDGTANMAYTFTRSGVTTDALTVNYTVGGTATFSTDYTQSGAATFTSTTGTVTFAANATTAKVTIDPTADTIVESNETVILTLAAGTGYTVGTTTPVTGTINDDEPPIINLAVSPASVTEDGTTNLIYTFTRSGLTTNSLTVNYTLGGTATLNTDYTRTGTNNTVTFAAGSSTATVTVDPTPDTIVESNETVILTLAAGTGYTVGTTTPVTGTITNDDTSVTLAVSPASVTEDGTTNLVYTFTRSGLTTDALTVNYTVGGTATFSTDYSQIGAASFTATTGTVNFLAGSSTATVTVDPTADTTVETDETVALTLAAGTGYIIGTTNAVTGTILNDDISVTPIEAFGDTKLVQDTTNKLYAQIGNNNPTAIKIGATQITTNIYPGWQTLAAETVNGVNQVLWKYNDGNYLHLWSLDSNWNWQSSSGWWGLNSPEAFTQETNFQQDFNGDGIIGQPYTPIEAFGNTKLVQDTTNKLYTQIGNNNPTAIKIGATQITTNIYPGWQTLAAETVNGVNQVLWK
ncbi:DUF4347 domain-containing protein, partial [Microcystis aeruginosa]|uniref:DUF4347 domain-containing protein n=1 Tax=Microcystis aeruginosa TaxID=1126 RepID=UPI001CB77B62